MNKDTKTQEGEILRGPHWNQNDFVPMKLVLQPQGPALPLKQVDNVIGRHSDCDLRLPLPDVSRRHCRVTLANGTWTITDLQSLNGVFVNEEKIDESPLKHGDIVRVGGFRFKVDLSEFTQTIRMSPEELKTPDRRAS